MHEYRYYSDLGRTRLYTIFSHGNGSPWNYETFKKVTNKRLK